jgi:hypothetical protein
MKWGRPNHHQENAQELPAFHAFENSITILLWDTLNETAVHSIYQQ